MSLRRGSYYDSTPIFPPFSTYVTPCDLSSHTTYPHALSYASKSQDSSLPILYSYAPSSSLMLSSGSCWLCRDSLSHSYDSFISDPLIPHLVCFLIPIMLLIAYISDHVPHTFHLHHVSPTSSFTPIMLS